MPSQPMPSQEGPLVAVYATALSPYEMHLYRRLAAELPIRLRVYVSRLDAGRNWQFESTEAVPLEDLSGGDRDTIDMRPPSQRREWGRGAKVIAGMRSRGARAMLISGYADIGRLRAIAWCARNGVAVFNRNDSNLASERGKSPLKLFLKKQFLRWLRPMVDVTFAIGPLGVEYWRHYGYPEADLITVPYEPDYTLVESITPEEVAEAAQRLGLDPARRRIVFSGRVTAQKRVDLLIDAFGRIAAERPEWDVLILGDGDLRAEIEASVPAGLRPRVRWAGFLADQRDVSRLYRACDVLALPSDFEPWALVVNEAAASGLALVTSDVVGAAAALVHEGRNGATFPRGDAAGFAEALLRVTAPETINRYKAESPRIVADWREKFDPVKGIREALVRTGVLPPE